VTWGLRATGIAAAGPQEEENDGLAGHNARQRRTPNDAMCCTVDGARWLAIGFAALGLMVGGSGRGGRGADQGKLKRNRE
jgi:hypothetical protein